jgi:hypothetical protein
LRDGFPILYIANRDEWRISPDGGFPSDYHSAIVS